VHILQPTKLFQDAFDSLGWVNKLSQLIEGGAQLSHVRVLPLLAKLEPLRRKISFFDKVKSGPIHPLLDVTFSHEQILAMLALDRSDYVRGQSAEKHAYRIILIPSLYSLKRYAGRRPLLNLLIGKSSILDSWTSIITESAFYLYRHQTSTTQRMSNAIC
jgi:hypothetical protein